MDNACDAYRHECDSNKASDGSIERDQMLDNLQRGLLELSNKFDRFLSGQFETGNLAVVP